MVKQSKENETLPWELDNHSRLLCWLPNLTPCWRGANRGNYFQVKLQEMQSVKEKARILFSDYPGR